MARPFHVVAALVLLAGAVGCDSGDDIEGTDGRGAVRPRDRRSRGSRP